MIVEYNPNGGFVSAQITVSGLVNFGYEFDTDVHIKRVDNVSGDSDSIDIGNPNTLNKRVNTWQIIIVNNSDEKQDFTQITEYMQDGDIIATSSVINDSLESGTTLDNPIRDHAVLFPKN